MPVGIPGFALSAGPAVSTSGGTLNAPFSVGSGSAGGLPTWLVIIGAAVAFIMWRKR